MKNKTPMFSIKKQTLAFSLSLVMGVNAVGMLSASTAMATDLNVAAPIVDLDLLNQSSVEGTKQQLESLQKTLAQVDTLIAKFEEYKKTAMASSDQPVVTFMRMTIGLIGLTSGMVHMKNAQADASLSLITTAVSGVLSTALESYVKNGRVDIDILSQTLVAHQAELSKGLDAAVASGDMSASDRQLVAQAVEQIGNINNDLSDTASEIQEKISVGQQEATLAAVALIGFKYLSKFLPASVRESLVIKMPKTTSVAQKAGQSGVVVGAKTLGTMNLAPLLSSLAGLTSPSAMKQIDKILANLYSTRANIIAQQVK